MALRRIYWALNTGGILCQTAYCPLPPSGD